MTEIIDTSPRGFALALGIDDSQSQAILLELRSRLKTLDIPVPPAGLVNELMTLCPQANTIERLSCVITNDSLNTIRARAAEMRVVYQQNIAEGRRVGGDLLVLLTMLDDANRILPVWEVEARGAVAAVKKRFVGPYLKWSKTVAISDLRSEVETIALDRLGMGLATNVALMRKALLDAIPVVDRVQFTIGRGASQIDQLSLQMNEVLNRVKAVNRGVPKIKAVRDLAELLPTNIADVVKQPSPSALPKPGVGTFVLATGAGIAGGMLLLSFLRRRRQRP